MNRIQPKSLQKGNTVAIVSTARKINLTEIQPAIDLLKSWDIHVVIGNTIGLEDHQFAGSDEERTKDFQNMLDDDNIDAVWCARGGYGTVRIIDQLDFTKFINNPKWIVGYSDVTVLHHHIHNLGFQTLHATMPIDINRLSESGKNTLKKGLFGESITYDIPSNSQNILGKVQGQLVGGNLSMLYSLLGSKSSIDTNGKILFIEDLDEYLYHIDRMMMNLKRNGYFEGLSGLIIGSMTSMHDNTIPFGKNVQEIILDCVSEYNFPVSFDFPAGHLDDNNTLVFGKEATLNVSTEKNTLTYNG